jgi:hypothetical protein
MGRYIILCTAFIVVAQVLNSCSSGSDTSVNGARRAFATPRVGSQFIYRDLAIDTNGNTIDRNDLFTHTIVASGLSYKGKNEVTQLEGNSNVADMSYVNHEPNGNLS